MVKLSSSLSKCVPLSHAELASFSVASLVLIRFTGHEHLLLSVLLQGAVAGFILLYQVSSRKCLDGRLSDEHLARHRLLLIRRMIDLAFTYSHDEKIFYRKFCDEVTIKALKSHKVVNVSEHAIAEGSPAEAAKGNLSSGDVEMCCMIQEGFSPQELSVVYGLKNTNSIYVKRHRLKCKLDPPATN